jgi:hypothetical protein
MGAVVCGFDHAHRLGVPASINREIKVQISAAAMAMRWRSANSSEEWMPRIFRV